MKSNGKGCRSKLQYATLVETSLLLCAEPNTIIAPNVGALVYLYTTRFDELDLIVGSTLQQTSLRTVRQMRRATFETDLTILKFIQLLKITKKICIVIISISNSLTNNNNPKSIFLFKLLNYDSPG